MGCCGKSRQVLRPQSVPNRQPIVRVEPKRVRPQAVGDAQPLKPAPVRQRVQPLGKCPVCGMPLSTVNIAGKNRSRCVNPSCRFQQ